MANRLTWLSVRTTTFVRGVVDRERGAGMVEYALLIALIAVVVISAVSLFTAALDASFSSTASSVAEA